MDRQVRQSLSAMASAAFATGTCCRGSRGCRTWSKRCMRHNNPVFCSSPAPCSCILLFAAWRRSSRWLRQSPMGRARGNVVEEGCLAIGGLHCDPALREAGMGGGPGGEHYDCGKPEG